MREKILSTFTELVPIIFASFLAALGGAVHYLNRIDKEGMKFKMFNFFLEIFTSGFVGIVTFMLCDSAGWEWHFTAAIVAISGHMGARALILLERSILPAFKGMMLSIIGESNGNSEAKTQQKEENLHAKERQE